MFLKEVSYSLQKYIYLIRKTGKAVNIMKYYNFKCVWRRAEIALGLVLYRAPCQCRALAWSFIVINRKVCSAELE